MASAQDAEEIAVLLLHHGTDQASANDLLQGGVNQQHAAVWNGSGEFWATTDHDRAKWFALSNPNSPPAACFEFELSGSALQTILQMSPPAARQHGQTDYEFLPASHAILNQHMANKRTVPVP
jgi:hypothetical protein